MEKDDSEFSIAVRGGVHDGATVLFPRGVHEVSGMPTSALCLRDCGVDEPLLLMLDKRGAALIGYDEVDDPVTLRKLPCDLALGDLGLVIGKPARATAPYRRTIALVLAIVGVISAGLVYQGFSHDRADAGIAASIGDDQPVGGGRIDRRDERTPHPIMTARQAEPTGAEDQDTTDDAITPRQALSDRFHDLGWQHAVELSLDGDVIDVTGELPEDDRKQLQEVQAWYDAEYSQARLISWNIDFVEQSDVPRLVVESIWFDKRSLIIANGGQHYFEGSILESGWVIAHIDRHRVQISRNGKTIDINVDSELATEEASIL